MSLNEDQLGETQDEDADSLTAEELELDLDDEVQEEETKPEDEIARLKEQNAQLYARLKKEQKNKTNPGSAGSGDNTSVDLDVLEFFSKGNTKDDYQNALAIMKGKGLTFEQALIDPLYTAHKQIVEAKAKKASAQLGASRGGSVAKRDEVRPGMSEEDHKALAMKRMGR